MTRTRLALSLPLVGLLALAACDSRDYEAEMGELQTQLDQARSELEAARAENQTLSGEMEEMQTQMGEATEAAGAAGGEALGEIEAQLNTVAQSASRSLEQLDQLAESGEQNVADAASGIREDLQAIVQSVHAAATSLGVQVESAVEGGITPAAGPAPDAGATQEEPAATEAEEGEEQPATQQ